MCILSVIVILIAMTMHWFVGIVVCILIAAVVVVVVVVVVLIDTLAVCCLAGCRLNHYWHHWQSLIQYDLVMSTLIANSKQ